MPKSATINGMGVRQLHFRNKSITASEIPNVKLSSSLVTASGRALTGGPPSNYRAHVFRKQGGLRANGVRISIAFTASRLNMFFRANVDRGLKPTAI